MKDLKNVFEFIFKMENQISVLKQQIKDEYYRGYLYGKYHHYKIKFDDSFILESDGEQDLIYSDSLEKLHDLEINHKILFVDIQKENKSYPNFKKQLFLNSAKHLIVDLPNGIKKPLVDLSFIIKGLNGEVYTHSIVPYIHTEKERRNIYFVVSTDDTIYIKELLRFRLTDIKNGIITEFIENDEYKNIEVENLYYFVKENFNIELF